MAFWDGAGGAIVGAVGSLLGSTSSAKQAKQQSREQMKFQERMSNTAYQRATTDLEAAGLNRILALGTPASTPAGAQAPIPDFGAAIASGAQAGSAIQTQRAQRKLMSQQGESAVASATRDTASARQLNATADITEKVAEAAKKGVSGWQQMWQGLTGKLDELGTSSAKEALKHPKLKPGRHWSLDPPKIKVNRKRKPKD